MNTRASILNAKCFICLVALAACAVLSATVKANGPEVAVKISVSAADLDLGRPGDAREVYRRFYFAARTVCGSGNRVGLEPSPSFVDCYEKALGGAVRSVNRPQLNIVYLATHTTRDAEHRGSGTYGCEVTSLADE